MCIGRTAAKAEAPILWPPDTKSQLIRKDSDAVKIEGKRREQQRMRRLDSITNMNLSKHWETVENRGAWCVAIHGISESQTRLSN